MEHEPLIRLGIFAGLLLLFAGWELWKPRRPRRWPRGGRWRVNFGLVAVDSVVLRIFFPLAATGVAIFAQEQGLGLFHHAPMPAIAGIVLAVILLDFIVYWQHRLFHKIPLLWRLHRVHHADLELDVSTGLRFHPVEILLSMLIKTGVILLLGLPAVGVLIFEVLLNSTSLFNHGNIYIPVTADRWLRRLVVTPDMHRVHHSPHAAETNSNFGFNLPWWDWLFRSYRDQPQEGHLNMRLGLDDYPEPLTFPRSLQLPFQSAGQKPAKSL
jgi:sterol desaturase/sphingolipid hydroxylase (fatty acid hydroxylase superfamily)